MDSAQKQNENEDEYEDVIIEFEGNFDLDAVLDKDIQMIGIDTEEPVLKIDAKFYKIDVQDSIGTRLLFKCDNDDKSTIEYHDKTDKSILAHRVMVKPK